MKTPSDPQWKRPKEIVFIRHGESLRNVLQAGHFYLPNAATVAKLRGRYDHEMPLTKRGREQATSGPKIMQDIGCPDFVYHSGYVRAKQTMDCLLGSLPPEVREKIEVRESMKLRERDPGYTWHMTEAEVNRYFPWHEVYRRRVGPLFYRPPGGESISRCSTSVFHNPTPSSESTTSTRAEASTSTNCTPSPGRNDLHQTQ